jgi:1,4-dihydroxy-2-naphthoate octaprenyltransferase
LKGDYLLLICILLCSLFIQFATNFFNDVIDHKKGADDFERLGPTRVTSSGLVPPQTVMKWAFVSVFMALIFGIPLMLKGGVPILMLGLLSLYLTYGYTGGKVSLAYRGLGELFVFLFFGLLSVVGTYYLLTERVNGNVFILGSVFGLLNTTLICINNLRDRDQDQRKNKLTLATRMTRTSYQLFIVTTILVPYLLMTLLLPINLWLLFFVAPLVFSFFLIVMVFKKKNAELNSVLAMAGGHLLLFGLTSTCVLFFQ